MSEQYKHLRIKRETLDNDRRNRKSTLPRPNRGDLRAHGQKLESSLTKAVERARKQLASIEGKFILKLHYVGALDFNHLNRHGVHFVSQENKQICVVFSDEQGLVTFADHLSKLGLNNTALTYRQILEALEGIDNWTAEDRQSWAVTYKGFPKSEKFKLDIFGLLRQLTIRAAFNCMRSLSDGWQTAGLYESTRSTKTAC